MAREGPRYLPVWLLDWALLVVSSYSLLFWERTEGHLSEVRLSSQVSVW